MLNRRSTIEIRNRLKNLIDDRVSKQQMTPHTAIVIEYTPGVELKVRITDIEGNPELSWRDGLLVVLAGQTFAVDDKLIIFPISGRFFVIGEVAGVLP